MHRAFAVAALGTVLVIGACGSSSRPGASHRRTSTSTRGTTSASSTPTVANPACTEAAVFPVVLAELERAGPVPLGVKELACEGVYGRLLTIPDNSGCGSGGGCYDAEQVFLKVVDGRWHLLTNGTGISCSDPAETLRPPELVDACRALGLR